MAKENPYAVQITRKGVMVWIGLLLFALGWMFVLGILVGRGTAPVPLQARNLEKELAALKTAMEDKEREQLAAQSGQGEPKSADLGFYEALKQPPPKPPAPSPRTVTAKVPQPKPAPPKPPDTQPAPPSRAKPAPAPKPDPAPAPKPAPEPAPTPAPAPPKPPAAQTAPAAAPAADAADRFTIQVAAFREAQSAEQMVATLRGKGYPAYHLRTTVADKGEWFRVRVGAFANREAAETMLRKLNGDQMQGMVIGTQ